MRLTVYFALLFSMTLCNTAMANVDVKILVLQRSYLQAIDCRTPQKLAQALKQSLKDTNSLTAKGHHASVFEELMMQNPSCFIQALNTLPKRTCARFAADYIQETFFYPRAAIKKSLSTAKGYSESCIAS